MSFWSHTIYLFALVYRIETFTEKHICIGSTERVTVSSIYNYIH